MQPFKDIRKLISEAERLRSEAASSVSEEECLKKGQTVVLMDSDLRGRIVSIGKDSVTIELEDGLLTEAGYGGFAVVRDENDMLLRRTRPSRKSGDMRTPSRLQSGGHIKVDLHIGALSGGRGCPKGSELQMQMEVFRRVMRENLRHRGMKITFVHGVGDGVLGRSIRKELEEIYVLRCSSVSYLPGSVTVAIR